MTKYFFAFVYFCIFSNYTWAQSSPWISIQTKDKTGDQIAGTYSDDGKSYLAMRCYQSLLKCAIVIQAPTKCDKDAEYPMLVNADDGALQIIGLCIPNEGKYEYLLTPYDKVRDLIYKDAGVIGFAMPLTSGEFRATRFSLTGAKKNLDVIFDKLQIGAGSKSSKSSGSYKF
jgi:hypothetical protein